MESTSSRWRAWLAPAALALWMVIDWARYGFSLSLLLWLGFGTAALFLDLCLERPTRSYYRCALFSIMLGALTVMSLSTEFGAVSLIAVGFWATVSLLMLLWTIYYERTEPR